MRAVAFHSTGDIALGLPVMAGRAPKVSAHSRCDG